MKTQDAFTRSAQEPHHKSLKELVATSTTKTPRIKALETEDHMLVTLDHPDKKVGHALLMKGIGTGDPDFYRGILHQITDRGFGREVVVEEVNFMLAVIEGLAPRNQFETMLAAQMAAVHVAAMKNAAELLCFESFPQRDNAERAFSRLTRTFAMQLDTFSRLRAGDAQTVTHVSVNDNAQAIVGNITQTSRENMLNKTAAPSPLALTDNKNAPMPIMEESKEKEHAEVSVRYRPKK